VPFMFETIVIYLQVHVINESTYKGLLRRPLNAVTRSTYRNDERGQTLVLKCPVTSAEVELETFE